jgi:parallel beta-helix repeat protein
MPYRRKTFVVFTVITIVIIIILALQSFQEQVLQASVEIDTKNTVFTVFPNQNGYTVKNRLGIIELYREEDAAKAINFALDSVADKGGKVFLTTGDYIITTSLKIHSNTVLEGEAIDDVNSAGFGTRLVAAKDLQEPILRNANPHTGDSTIIIRTIAFDGSRQNKDRTIGATGINLTKTVRCRIVDVTVYNCKDSGIVFDGSGGTVEAFLERVSSRGNNYAGLHMKTQSDFHIYNSEFGSNQGFGILLTSCSSGSIIGCNVFLNKQSGIQLYNTKEMRLLGNRANHNDKSGIEIVATAQGRGDFNSLIGNHCYNNGQHSTGGAGIKIDPRGVTIRDCVIAYNTCFDDQFIKTQNFGILEQIGGEKNLIIGNNCKNNKLEDIKVSGSIDTIYPCKNDVIAPFF